MIFSRGLQGDVVCLSWPIALPYMSPNAGGRGGGGWGVSANENSCAQHVTWSPNKLWRSNSTLWFLASIFLGSYFPLPSACIGRLYLLRREQKDKKTDREGGVIDIGRWSLEPKKTTVSWTHIPSKWTKQTKSTEKICLTSYIQCIQCIVIVLAQCTVYFLKSRALKQKCTVKFYQNNPKY